MRGARGSTLIDVRFAACARPLQPHARTVSVLGELIPAARPAYQARVRTPEIGAAVAPNVVPAGEAFTVPSPILQAGKPSAAYRVRLNFILENMTMPHQFPVAFVMCFLSQALVSAAMPAKQHRPILIQRTWDSVHRR